MKVKHIVFLFLTIFNTFQCNIVKHYNKKVNFTEAEILEQLDLAFNGIPSSHYPRGESGDIKYNFFLDLENGYLVAAGNRIHLYSDATRWAVVFEQNGYNNRGFNAEINLYYVGNCIDYPIHSYPGRKYISNLNYIRLISDEEYERISNKEGSDREQFELISPTAKDVLIRDSKVKIEHGYRKYEQVGIKLRKYNNPNKLIGFGDLIRYLNETNPGIINATEDEIKKHIPVDLPKLMTINEFHFTSIYDKEKLPSQQEMYQLIAKVLVNRDSMRG